MSETHTVNRLWPNTSHLSGSQPDGDISIYVIPPREAQLLMITKNGHAIDSLEHWFTFAPPKDPAKQWVDGRSAKEAAKAWLECQGSLPREIAALLATTGSFESLAVDRIEPEALIAFDNHGGPRNADVAVWARDAHGLLAITVEAKADETFDQLVSKVFAASLERLIGNPRSGGVARLSNLARALFRPTRENLPPVTSLRYQLLTATAGTLALAESVGASRAVFVVQEFHTSVTSRRKLELNDADFRAFIRRLSNGAVSDAASGTLYGPFDVPGEPLFSRPPSLFIGKALRRISTPGE